MLDVNPEIVCHLIELAGEFQAREAVVIPQEPLSPSDDWGRQALANHISDKTFQEFQLIIQDLEPDQQQQVVALLWLGREDATLEEWDTLLEEARANWNTNTAGYLMAHPQLADFLLEGLQAHGYSCDR